MTIPGWSWWIALAGLVAGGSGLWLVPSSGLFVSSATDPSGAVSGERWACPMMDFIGNHPGSCPVCGMAMNLVTAGDLSREQLRRMGVRLTTIEEGPALITVHAYGTTRYDERSEQVVVARVAGRVVRRHDGALHVGTMVQAGDPLLDLYSPEVFAAQGELAAAVKLGEAGLIRSLAERFARWNLAPVAEAISKGGSLVDTVTIRSPFSGRTVLDAAMGTTGMVKVGAEIMPDAPILRLVDPEAFIVVLQVPETQSQFLRNGQPVALASDDAGELPEVEARINWLSPDLNPRIRSREVHLHLRDPRHRLLPGSLVHARLRAVLAPDLGPADPDDPRTWGRFPLVPAEAVLSTGVRHVAWRCEKIESDGRQRFALATLALGPRLEDATGRDHYVVRAGLAVGDRVAGRGAFLIDSQAQLAGSPSLLFPVGAAAPTPAR